jgi:cell division protein ZapA (FtsZ GTPase activity inhibitor)
MADLKPIGSEKLQGQDKINRILEIARYKENTPSSLNETSRVEFERVLADGNNYEIVKEKSGYVIKKKVNESLEYIEPMKNRKHYGSYSAALKRLNLIAGEVNRLTENEEEVSMFNLGEQKKFTLKTPKPVMPAPAPEAAPALPTPPAAPEAGSMDAPLDDASLDAPEGDEMDFDMDVESPEGDMDVEMDAEEGPMGGEEEEVTFKTIQKLTGKLGQKIRMMNDSVGMTSEDVKYVINSLLSALDLSKLDEEDQEDIMAKFEEDQESDYDSDMDMGSMGDDDELDMDMEMDVEEPMDGEMGEGDVIGVYSDIDKQRDEMSEEDKINSHVSKVMDEIFSESKIDKVLSSYFEITESEKKEKKQKLNESKKVAVSSIKRLSETIEQELAAEFIVRENSNYKLVGKTNKSNLVFEHNGEQIRVTPKGEVL